MKANHSNEMKNNTANADVAVEVEELCVSVYV